MNPYHIGVGSWIITALEVIILAFLWRGLSARLAGSENPTSAKIGASMGATL